MKRMNVKEMIDMVDKSHFRSLTRNSQKFADDFIALQINREMVDPETAVLFSAFKPESYEDECEANDILFERLGMHTGEYNFFGLIPDNDDIWFVNCGNLAINADMLPIRISCFKEELRKRGVDVFGDGAVISLPNVGMVLRSDFSSAAHFPVTLMNSEAIEAYREVAAVDIIEESGKQI